MYRLTVSSKNKKALPSSFDGSAFARFLLGSRHCFRDSNNTILSSPQSVPKT
jgi:hypothetical protein